ncbi:MAG: S9 family peptidase [Bryobacterales bacterium]|nr:S9 family peptidase [Bryobacterales bacterium]
MRLVAMAVLCAVSVFGKSAITHETLWMMKRVSAPVVSPDGKWVVFTLTEPSYNEAEQATDLWLVPTDGSAAARRLTATKGGESGAAWTPDSRRILFAAKRDGDEVGQIYELDLSGGEAQRITSVSTGASDPAVSRDGKRLLFVSRVYAGAKDDAENKKIAAERKARKYNARVYESFPIRNWDRWLDDLQTHVFVQEFGGGAAKDLLAGTKLAAQAGFGGATTSGGDSLQPVWSPDSQSVVFTATVNRNAAAYSDVATHLYQAPVSGGEPKALTGGKDSYGSAKFAADGRSLYAVMEANNGKIYNCSRLVRMAWPDGGAARVVSGELDSSVNTFAVSADNKTVYISAEQHGQEKLFVLPAEGGKPSVAAVATSGVYGSLQTSAQPFLIGTWSSAVNPAEIVRIDVAGKSQRFLTDFNNAKAAEIDWQPVEHFWFTAKNGRRIHNMVVRPPAFDAAKKYPLLVLIHGGPHTMWRDEITLRWNYHLLAAPGYVVLLTNYTGSTGFGERFAQTMHGDPLRGPGEELNEAADEAVKRFGYIDGGRQCAGGASYGGHLANWLQATTTRYRCLISHAGLINMESQWGTSDTIYHREVMAGGPVWEQGTVWREQNPIRYAKNFRTPILVTVGENDFRVPLNQTLENWSVLQRLRVPSKLIVFPGANHWILKAEDSRFFYGEVHGWLERHLKP